MIEIGHLLLMRFKWSAIFVELILNGDFCLIFHSSALTENQFLKNS